LNRKVLGYYLKNQMMSNNVPFPSRGRAGAGTIISAAGREVFVQALNTLGVVNVILRRPIRSTFAHLGVAFLK
jgi:hypothetical protein